MKTRILLPSIALCMAVAAHAQVSELPEKIYVNSETDHQTHVFNNDYVEQIGIIHGASKLTSRQGYYDSLQVVKSDGVTYTYPIAGVDSITFYVPDSLMRAHIEYQDTHYASYYPTYSDNYLSYAGWSSRNSWQLANIHDPTVMKAADGYYYMSQTDAGYGNPTDGKGHFYVRRSLDMINWEPVTTYNNSCVLPNEVPSWFLDSINSVRSRRGLDAIPDDSLTSVGYWAPVMRQINDTLYRCYYCLVPGNYIKTGGNVFDGSWEEGSWIGMAETSDPGSGVWTDKGGVICSASDQGKDEYSRKSTSDWNAYCRFNAIDPTYVITPEGEHWLAYGSWHSGFAAIQIDPETGKTMETLGDPWDIGTGTTTTYGTFIATRLKSSRWQGSEGPEIIYNPETGYYYLFMAYDALDISYNTRVARATSITGPYYSRNSLNLTSTGGDCYPIVTHPYAFDSNNDPDGWVGISHCCVWNDGEGQWYFCCQGRKPEGYMDNDYANALMMGLVRKIYWDSDGWPVISPERYGGVEQAPISVDDLYGTWELISLAYSYGNQQTSSTLTIKSTSIKENRVRLTGAFSGYGDFDPDTNILAIWSTNSSSSSAVDMMVSRELDWEASPRQSTIVFAGYGTSSGTGSNTTTYWAKKIADADE